MRVATVPRHGGIHVSPSGPGGVLRITAHPDEGIVVLSMWRGDYCLATHEIPLEDVPDIMRMMAQSLLPAQAQPPSAVAS